MIFMLLLHFLIPIIKAAGVKIPKMKTIYIYPEKADYELNQMEEEDRIEYEENMKGCLENFNKDVCEIMYGMINNPIYTNKINSELNSVLSNVPSDIDILLIHPYHFNGEIDFSYLPKKMMVTIMGSDIMGSKILSDINDSKNIEQKLRKKIKKKIFKILATKAYDDPNEMSKILISKKRQYIKSSYVISLNGNINDKVSYLYITMSNVKIIKNDLNCENSNFMMVEFMEGIQKIKSKYFIADSYTHKYIDMDIIDVDQYSLLVFDLEDDPQAPEDTYLRISYLAEKWALFIKYDENSYYESLYSNVPYSSAKSFGVLVLCFHIEVICDTEMKIVGIKNVNLSLIQNVNQGGAMQTAKDVVYISTSGWENQDEKPKLYVTADQSKYSIDSKNAKDINVEVQSLYNSAEGQGKEKSGSKTTIIVVVVVVVVVVVAIVIVIVVVVIIKKKKVGPNSSDEGNSNEQPNQVNPYNNEQPKPSNSQNNDSQNTQNNNQQNNNNNPQYPQNYNYQQYPQNYNYQQYPQYYNYQQYPQYYNYQQYPQYYNYQQYPQYNQQNPQYNQQCQQNNNNLSNQPNQQHSLPQGNQQNINNGEKNQSDLQNS